MLTENVCQETTRWEVPQMNRDIFSLLNKVFRPEYDLLLLTRECFNINQPCGDHAHACAQQYTTHEISHENQTQRTVVDKFVVKSGCMCSAFNTTDSDFVMQWK